ncbi:MAG TPA: sigma 54-interacting transcriptional regulator [Candidatus Acidoferrum sp.]|nr:sigma 54-interacting transcriptional regulator [Candidatus Acidoferrum sp.]
MSSFPTVPSIRPSGAAFVRGHSPAIEALNSFVEEIALTSIPVLLTGESGTGKEVYGRMIHRLSQYGHIPLRKVSCRAVEQTELFALKLELRQGAKGSANGLGTLFLDNIDELDLENQRILLSILPDGETDENGSSPVRLIASTSRNLEKEIESGKFRRELYFRINGVGLHLPPLRDRKEDIHLFVVHFLAKHATELGREIPMLHDREMEFLVAHDWPGNVRELENLARRVVLVGDCARAIQELGERPMRESGNGQEPRVLSLKAAARTASRRAERDLIAKALELTHWNRKRAAQQLQISYKSLLYKIKQTGLEEK